MDLMNRIRCLLEISQFVNLTEEGVGSYYLFISIMYFFFFVAVGRVFTDLVLCETSTSSSSTKQLGSTKPEYRPMWRYDDESAWPGLKCKQGGQRQSPIDIRTGSVNMDHEMKVIKHGKLQLNGYRSVLVSGVNNGHTVQFTMDGNEAMHPTLTGGPLEHNYRLEQMHFHWLSEHSLDGVKYPLEIHFVHIRTDLSVARALEVSDGLAIIAVFCNIQPESEMLEGDETEMEEVMQHVPKLKRFGSRVSGVVLDMMRLMSKNPQSYVTYSGSLTSPECNEVVTWIIMDNPIFISDSQYELFNEMSFSRHNFRSLQRYNQSLWRPSIPYLKTPFLFRIFQEMIDMVVGFFRNVTGMAKESKEKLLR